MDEFNKFKIFFRTRNYCSIKVPKNIKKKQKIIEFIVDKIVSEEMENWIEKWLDFEIEDFEIIEDEE